MAVADACCAAAARATSAPIVTAATSMTPRRRGALPEEAVLASLGCGNPTALIDLHEGETVLDLGSGGGIDVLLSARRVGANRLCLRAGYDRRDAGPRAGEQGQGRRHQRRLPQGAHRGDPAAGERGGCGHQQLRDQPRGGQRPGAARGVPRAASRAGASPSPMWWRTAPCPTDCARNMEAWVGCLAGALEIDDYTRLLTDAGFTDVSMTITRRYTAAEAGLDPRRCRRAGRQATASSPAPSCAPPSPRTAPRQAEATGARDRCAVAAASGRRPRRAPELR